MLYRDISRVLANYLWILLIPLFIPFLIAIYCEFVIGPEVYPQLPCSKAFFLTLLTTAILGLFFWWIGKRSSGRLFRREALLLVILVYCLTSIIASLPFVISRTLPNPLDALFEAVSGITTTGATIMEAKQYDESTGKESQIKKTFTVGLDKIETIPYSYFGTIEPVKRPNTDQILYTGIDAVNPALLFWRSFMQWLGGGGIIVLFVAILPALGVGGKILYQTEMTGPSKESIFPRIKETASMLWKAYLGLTIIEIILLVLTNEKISLFDAIMISFSTISTGGFSPKNESIGAYQSVYTDWIIVLFMILGSISFTIYFFCMRGRFFRLNDLELKVFLVIIIVSCALATWELLGRYPFLDAFRLGTFQAISAQTSTGFNNADYDVWPFTIQVHMLILMFIGGMAGSTAGGIKVIRLQTFFRILLNKIEMIFRPDTVRTYRIGTSIIDNRTATIILCFLMIVASLTIVGTYLFVLDGYDPETSLTCISCLINNAGFAFGMGARSFAFLNNFGKVIGCIWMIAGRLEFFAILIAFVPAFWRSK